MLLLAGLLLVSAGTGGALAQQDSPTPDDEVRIVDHEITISDATITISDAILSGSGTSDTQIDHRKYTVEEATLEFNGVHVTVQGTEYVFCDITVNVDNVGLVLENVKVN
ncbi:hypothetical protein ACFQL7_26895 [Halocatena marina]|uniref:Uncharacterized protein n=2 Tax=Halocatena marina TaxID=2934937 RepID=A0ABD5YVY6_9EURY